MTVIQRKANTGKKGKQEKKRKERKTEQKTSYMRAGRRPSPEGTRSLFAGTISPMICPGDGPTEGRHDKTRRKARKKEKKRKMQRHRARKNKPAFLCPAGGATTTQTMGKAEIEGQK